MGARRGGQEGALIYSPPLEIQKYGGPPKDNLTRTFFLNIEKIKRRNWTEGPHIVCEETDLRGPPIVSKETDLRGPPYSMQSNLCKGAPT